jgi:hypothetical protein
MLDVRLTLSIKRVVGVHVSLPSRPCIPFTQFTQILVLNMAGKLGKCLMGMNYALGSVPVTVKMRTGVKDGFPTAHKLMSRVHDWGVSSVAVTAALSGFYIFTYTSFK